MSTGTPRYGMCCTTHRPISSVDAAVADYGNAVTLFGEHAEIARRLAELPPEQRLPFMTLSERLFWEWANRRPPVPDPALTDCPHTTTTAPPPAEPAPTPQQSINQVIAEAIAWSREQQRRGPPPVTVTIGGRTYTQRDLDKRYLGLRELAHQLLDDAVRGRMYEGCFPTPTSQEEADEWEQERLSRLRRQG